MASSISMHGSGGKELYSTFLYLEKNRYTLHVYSTCLLNQWVPILDLIDPC